VASFQAINGSSVSTAIGPYDVNVRVQNFSGSSATLIGWIDWNNDGIFSALGEARQILVPDGSNGIFTLHWGNPTITGSARTGTYARFRLAQFGQINANTPANNNPSFNASPLTGEVEDYYIPFTVILPVTLIEFTATKASGQQKTDLYWQTSSEQNSKNFIIERSIDDNTWSDIGNVAAAGNSSSSHSYSYTDNKPVTGINYYRLRQTDINGKTSYSDTRLINFGSNAKTAVLPNPVKDRLYITNVPANTQLRLLGTDGTMLLQRPALQGSESLDMSGYAHGFYILQYGIGQRESGLAASG